MKQKPNIGGFWGGFFIGFLKLLIQEQMQTKWNTTYQYACKLYRTSFLPLCFDINRRSIFYSDVSDLK